MDNFIIKLLDLKEENIEDISVTIEHGVHSFNITLKRKQHSCPHCFKMTSKVKDYRLKKLSHQVYKHINTTISYNCRRYVCPYCNKTFNEDSPFGLTYTSISTSVLLAILNDLKHYTATYTHIATQYHLSPSTIIKIFDNHVQINRHRLQKVLNIDEVYFNCHSKHKYAFMIMGFENNLIIDIVESRKHKELSSYFFCDTHNRKKRSNTYMHGYVFAL